MSNLVCIFLSLREKGKYFFRNTKNLTSLEEFPFKHPLNTGRCSRKEKDREKKKKSKGKKSRKQPILTFKHSFCPQLLSHPQSQSRPSPPSSPLLSCYYTPITPKTDPSLSLTLQRFQIQPSNRLLPKL